MVVWWQTLPMGTVLMRRPPTVLFKLLHAQSDGQQESVGPHLHCALDEDHEESLVVWRESTTAALAEAARPKATAATLEKYMLMAVIPLQQLQCCEGETAGGTRRAKIAGTVLYKGTYLRWLPAI